MTMGRGQPTSRIPSYCTELEVLLGAKNDRIAELKAELERTVTTQYHDDLMHQWHVANVALKQRIEVLEEQLHYTKGCCNLAMKHRNAAEARLYAVRELAETWDKRKNHLPDPLAREIYRICTVETRKALRDELEKERDYWKGYALFIDECLEGKEAYEEYLNEN
jgi:hypothetical protein